MIRSQRQLFLFRGRLWKATGLAALGMPLIYGAACGGEAIVEQEDQSSSDAATTTANTTAGPSSGQGGAQTSVTASGQGGAQTSVTVGQGGASTVVETCFVNSPNAPCPDLASAPSVFGVCTVDGYFIQSWISGPKSDGDQCCYEVEVSSEFCGVGRPLSTPEGAATARAVSGERAWGTARASAGELDPEARAELAEAFARDGLFEHASVASFSRVALELMALGAPPELIAGAHRAALDEIRHAKLCFALASRFAGEPIGPGPLEAAGALALRTDLVELAVSTFVEGCIGETLSAALAQEQAARATDREARQALAIIAADEARHAELAWCTIAWALERGGAPVRDAVGKALIDAAKHAPFVPSPEDDRLERFGRLSVAVVREVQRRALLDVVLPCAFGLLARHSEWSQRDRPSRRQPSAV